MRPSSSKAYFQGNHPDYLRRITWFTFAVSMPFVIGCEEEPRNPGRRPETRALEQTGVSVGLDEKPNAVAKSKLQAKASEPIIGQRTTDIRNAGNEHKEHDAQVASQRIIAKDPISLQGNAYVSIVGQAAVGNMKHAMDLFYAENERYPKDYDEFMTVIVKPHGIALPQLPPYQKYGYDEKEHKLIVQEYPDLKN
jgi:hypothetical protein